MGGIRGWGKVAMPPPRYVSDFFHMKERNFNFDIVFRNQIVCNNQGRKTQVRPLKNLILCWFPLFACPTLLFPRYPFEIPLSHHLEQGKSTLTLLGKWHRTPPSMRCPTAPRPPKKCLALPMGALQHTSWNVMKLPFQVFQGGNGQVRNGGRGLYTWRELYVNITLQCSS